MRRWRAKFSVCALLLSGCMFFARGGHAQSGQPSQPGAPSAEDAQSSSGPENKATDELDQFKHSAAVKWLARHTGLSQDGAYWLAVGVNFAVVAGFIFWAAKKTLPTKFRNRTAEIQKSMAEARRASEDANRRLTDIESRLGRLGDEIAAMRATAEQEATAEEARIKAAAEEDARHIVESAGEEIAAAAKAAQRELKSYAADLAVTLAAQQIRVDVPTDQALLRRFTSQLENGNGAGKEKKN